MVSSASTASRLVSGLSAEPAVEESLSFSDIYRLHFPFVWRSARGLGVAPAALDDVVQEIFVVLHRRLPEFAGRSTLRTWISGIVLNVVRRHRRTLIRKSPHELVREPPADPESLRATANDPYEALAQREGTLLLQRLLDELDDDKREMLVLADLEELPVPEIAEALDLKLNTAYSRLRLARHEFDQALARHRAQDRRRCP
jgi:RNA polymerase sigma-70 factor (ECF subfamily)